MFQAIDRETGDQIGEETEEALPDPTGTIRLEHWLSPMGYRLNSSNALQTAAQ
jgi:hypothetical protein